MPVTVVNSTSEVAGNFLGCHCNSNFGRCWCEEVAVRQGGKGCGGAKEGGKGGVLSKATASASALKLQCKLCYRYNFSKDSSVVT